MPASPPSIYVKLISHLKNYKKPYMASALSLWALCLRLQRIAINPPQIGGDSFYQVHTMDKAGSFWAMVKSLPKMSQGGFLEGDYILIYPFFKMFGYDKWGLAIPHLLITLLGFYFLYLICKQCCRTIWGYLITFGIVCFNWNLIFYSVDIRAYAVLPTLALMTFYFSKRLVDQNIHMSIKQKWGIGLFFIVVLWFHVYGVVIIFCTTLFVLLGKLHDRDFQNILKDLVKFLVIVGLIAAPLWCYSVFGPHVLNITTGLDANRENARIMNTFDYIPNPLVNLVGFLKGVFGNLMGYRKFYVLLLGVFIPFVLPYKERFKHIAFFLALVILPIAILLVGVLSNGYWFLQRQFTWVMPFFALSLAQAWESLICYITDFRIKRAT